MHRFTTRTRHRKRAIDTLFEAQQRGFGDDPQAIRELVEQRQLVTAAQTVLPPYAVKAVNGVAENLVRIDTLIATYSRDWDIDRIAATDLAAMRIAVWEMIANNEEVDPRVAIDQAVTIVATIGTDRSPSFVNAILDKIRLVLESENKQLTRTAKQRVGATGTSGDLTAANLNDDYESSWERYRKQTQLQATAIEDSNADNANESDSHSENTMAANDAHTEDISIETEGIPDSDEDENEAEIAAVDLVNPKPSEADNMLPVDTRTETSAERFTLGEERRTIPSWLLSDLVDDYEIPTEDA